jgi:hypothetical protein
VTPPTIFQEGGITSSTVAVEASDEATGVRVPSTVGAHEENGTVTNVVVAQVADTSTITEGFFLKVEASSNVMCSLYE